MKKTNNFVWSDAANAAFEDLKKQLAEPPMLAAPVDKGPLLLYVAANARAVSVAIVVERKEAGKEYPVQRPVYYISEVLIESKQRYPHRQKLVYGVFMASRKLKQYFLGHPSLWLVLLLWEISFKTERPQDESPSGPLNLGFMV